MPTIHAEGVQTLALNCNADVQKELLVARLGTLKLWPLASKLQETATLRARFAENTTLQFFDRNHHVHGNLLANNTNRWIKLV